MERGRRNLRSLLSAADKLEGAILCKSMQSHEDQHLAKHVLNSLNHSLKLQKTSAFAQLRQINLLPILSLTT